MWSRALLAFCELLIRIPNLRCFEFRSHLLVYSAQYRQTIYKQKLTPHQTWAQTKLNKITLAGVEGSTGERGHGSTARLYSISLVDPITDLPWSSLTGWIRLYHHHLAGACAVVELQPPGDVDRLIPTTSDQPKGTSVFAVTSCFFLTLPLGALPSALRSAVVFSPPGTILAERRIVGSMP
jgi:CRP-like cAMP-binding protein